MNCDGVQMFYCNTQISLCVPALRLFTPLLLESERGCHVIVVTKIKVYFLKLKTKP